MRLGPRSCARPSRQSMAMAERRRTALPVGLCPRYLSREEEAAYLGVAPETFDEELRAGWWPKARHRGAKGTRLTWDRLAIDACADRASGLAGLPAQAAPDEAGLVAAAEAAALQGVADAARRHRAKHRQHPCMRASR